MIKQSEYTLPPKVYHGLLAVLFWHHLPLYIM
nr:MAG TPA: hypothetical protein [Caudoviricetes sp.]